MKPRNFITCLFLILISTWLYAGGITEWQEAEGKEDWKKEFDLQETKPGTHNVIIKAIDFAGNESIAGPFNIKVDPASDLPVVRIVSPQEHEVVRNAFNIVGVAVDDDGVARVLVKLDDGSYQTAEGTEYWRVAVPVSRLTEGTHTISVKAVDVNGTEGPEITSTFVLDTTPPVIEFTSHQSGALVSGKTALEGVVRDETGVKALTVTIPSYTAVNKKGEEEQIPEKTLTVGLKYDKGEGLYRFSLPLDTRPFPDGPYVWWFTATDGTGTEVSTPFLLFVDNEPATLSVLSPEDEAVVFGKVGITGTVRDAVGVKRLWYTFKGEEHDLELIPGNPYWHLTLDTSQEKDGTLELTVHAEDASGNISSLKIRLKNDRKAFQPQVELLFPAPEEGEPVLTPDEVLAGRIVGPNPPEKVRVLGMGDDPKQGVEIPASMGFYVPLEGLPPGRHTLTLIGVDVYGLESPPVKVSFQIASTAPVLTVEELVYTDTGESLAWKNGLTYDASRKAVLRGRITSQEKPSSGVLYVGGDDLWALIPLDPEHLPQFPNTVRKASLKISPAEEGGYVFEAALDPKAGHGALAAVFALTMRDGNSYLFPQVISYQAPPPKKEGETLPTPTKPDEVFLLDHRLSNGTMVWTDRTPLVGFFSGEGVREVALEGAGDLLTVRHEGNHLIITPQKAGKASGVQVVVTSTDGRTYRSPRFNVEIDLEPPVLTLHTPSDGAYLNTSLAIEGEVEDDAGLPQISYRLDGGSWVTISTSEARFSTTVSVSQIGPGPHLMEVKAVDGAGHAVYRRIHLFYDATPPTLAFTTPEVGKTVNGTILVAGSIATEAPVVRFGYLLEQGAPEPSASSGESEEAATPPSEPSFTPLSPEDGIFSFTIDFSRLAEEGKTMKLIAEDAAGNTSETILSPPVDLSLDKPRVEIQTPPDDFVVTKDVTIAGMAFDDDGISKIVWKLDDGTWQEVPAQHTFSFTIPLSSLSDNEHTVEIYAVDLFGLQGEIASKTLRVSLSEPEGAMVSPTVEETVKGTVILKGTAGDANGIDSVRVSFDNGNSFHFAHLTIEGTEWTYPLDTTILTDGTYAVQFVVRDGYGIEASYSALVNVDNTPPEITLTTPEEGGTVSGEVRLSGRVSDNIQLTSFKGILEPINNQLEPMEVTLPLERVLTTRIPLDELPPGWYNLRLEARDGAGNVALVDRNLFVVARTESASVRILFPSEGEVVHGPVVVEGVATAPSPVEKVQLFLEDGFLTSADVNPRGYFRAVLDPGKVPDGEVTIKAVLSHDGAQVESEPRSFIYQKTGPYLTLESHMIGDMLANRPWIRGTAAYLTTLDPEDPDYRKKIREFEVVRIQVSLDNGRTFEEIPAREEWEYRVETGFLSNGPLPVLVQASFRNGETAVLRTLFVVDKIPPEVKAMAPLEGDRVNEKLVAFGVADDNFGLKDVQISLRAGDKAGYEIPEFIQGMYLDAHFLGMTYWKAGLGLTFFDNNVKLQVSYGLGPRTTADGKPARLSGQFISGKLLASLLSVPFESFLGPDWDWLSLKLALGADFSYILLYDPIEVEEAEGTRTISSVVLSAILAQLEFPIVEVKRFPAFHTYSLYVEPELWFIPSDVDPKIVPKITFGTHVVMF